MNTKNIRLAPASLQALAVLASAGLVIPGPAMAQQGCQDSETIGECWDRHYGSEELVRAEAKTGAFDSEFLRLAGKLTGLGADVGPSLASGVDDFLPIIAGAPTIDSGSGSELGFVVDANLPMYQRPGRAIQPPNLSGTVKLRLQTRTPTAWGPLIESVAPEQRSAVREGLEEGLDQFDDVTLSASWNLETESTGRSFGKHANTLDGLLAATVDMVQTPGLTLTQALLGFEERLISSVDSVSAEERPECDKTVFKTALPRDYPLDCFKETFRKELGLVLAQAATARRDYKAAIDSTLKNVGFFRLADLVNNQPQFSITGSARLRSEVVGPNTYALGLRYERGFASLNALKSSCADRAKEPTVACLSSFLADPRVVSSLRRSDRLWLSFDVGITSAYAFEDSLAGIVPEFQQDAAVTLKAGAGYGRYLRVDPDGNETARIDLQLEGELNESKSGRNDRFVASLTYTQRVSESISLPLGITYANKPEFIGEADARVGMHVGLRYRLQRDPPDLPDTGSKKE